MSIAAMAWVFEQEIRPSSVKFVLLALADYMGSYRGENTVWPSIASLAAKTSQDRKTVIAAIDTLVEQGFLVDTGERVGKTSQIKKYSLNLQASQKRNGSDIPLEESQISLVTVPFFPDKSPENGTRNQKGTGKGTVNESSEYPALFAVEGFQEEWSNFILHRKSLKKVMTERARKIILNKLSEKPEKALHALSKCIERGWQSFEWHYFDDNKNSPRGEKPRANGFEIDQQLESINSRQPKSIETGSLF